MWAAGGRHSDLDDGQIGTGRLEKVDDVVAVARHHCGGEGDGCDDDRPIDDVGGAGLGEDPADAVNRTRWSAQNARALRSAAISVPAS
jgi:hypothetical protein